MKQCANCAASNADLARFCNECGAQLNPFDTGGLADRPGAPHDPTRRSNRDPTVRSSDGQTPIDQRKRESSKPFKELRKADVLFILDCTASMRGELDAIRDTIIEFVNSVCADGMHTRVGLVEFRDRLNGEEHQALLFDGHPFTANAAAFQAEVSKLKATGGGDEPESSLDAILLALKQPFDAEATKILVLVTDAPPHIPDKDAVSVEEVSDAIKKAGVKQFHMIIRTQHAKSQVYLQLLEGTRGLAFELGRGNDFRSRAQDFKQILMNLGKTISRSR